MASHGTQFKVVSVKPLGRESLFGGYSQLKVKPAGILALLSRPQVYLLPPDSGVLSRGQRLDALPPRAQPVEDIGLQALFRGMVAGGVRIRQLRWEEQAGKNEWTMNMVLERDAGLFDRLYEVGLSPNLAWSGYHNLMSETENGGVRMQIIYAPPARDKTGPASVRMDLLETYRYLQSVAQ